MQTEGQQKRFKQNRFVKQPGQDPLPELGKEPGQ